jgi:hypothetical protein
MGKSPQFCVTNGFGFDIPSPVMLLPWPRVDSAETSTGISPQPNVTAIAQSTAIFNEFFLVNMSSPYYRIFLTMQVSHVQSISD